jgi:hypothetical protein
MRLTERNEWKFFAVLPRADGVLATVWWIVLVLRGVLPAVFAIAMGVLVGAVQQARASCSARARRRCVRRAADPDADPSGVGANLGDRTAAWLYDRLTEACVRPPGMGISKTPSSPAISRSRATSISA